MTRVKRGVAKSNRRKKIIKAAKGSRFGNSTKFKEAKVKVLKAGNYAFNDRRKKKRVFRQLWQIRISALLKKNNLNYSNFIHQLQKNNILLNRKILSEIAQTDESTFNKILEKTK